MKPTTSERRQEDRVTSALPLRIGGFGDKDGAVLRNLSLSGLSCLFEQEVAEGQEVAIRMQLPALPEEKDPDYAFEALGIIVRCHPLVRPTSRLRFEIAVYFAELPEKSQAVLRQYIAIRSQQTDE